MRRTTSCRCRDLTASMSPEGSVDEGFSMKFSRFSRISIGIGTACLVAASAGVAATANESDVPTYKEFKADTYVDFDGQYVVNGDEPIVSDGDLKKFYN